MAARIIDLGDVEPLVVYITNDAGQPADAGGITLTITQPDSSTVTPAVTHTALGTYTVNYQTVQAGRHVARWVATGANASAFVDVFHVLAADPRFLISLDDARAQLRKPSGDTVDDDELRLYLAAVTPIVEDVAGAQASQSGTTTFDGGKGAVLLPVAVTAIIQVTENGVALAAGSDYTVNLAAGIVHRGTQVAPYTFIPGHQNIVVSWTASGVDDANVRLAARIILRQLWQADQVGGGRPGVGGAAPANDMAATPSGFAIPRRAMELLTPNAASRMPGFA